MNTFRFPLYLLFAGLLAVSLTACDQSSQNVEFEPGENLSVTGPGEVIIPNYDSSATPEYFVEAFTIEQDYNWSVSDNAEILGTRRDGEYVEVASPTSLGASYSVNVGTTIDGQERTGSATTTVANYPSILSQADKYGHSIFAAAVTNVGLDGALTSRSVAPTGYTAFIPTNEAFITALDTTAEGELNLPQADILADVLTYHVVPDSLTSSDLSTTSVGTVFNEDELLDVNTSGGVSVDGVSVTDPDIANNVGVAHEVDQVLLPTGAVAFKDQEARRGANEDTLTVAGDYISEGGFVVLHDSTELADASNGMEVAQSVVGNSAYLEPGFHESVTVITDDNLDAQAGESITLTAMLHRDTDGDETYDFSANLLTVDGPYRYDEDSNNPAIVDHGTVTIPE